MINSYAHIMNNREPNERNPISLKSLEERKYITRYNIYEIHLYIARIYYTYNTKMVYDNWKMQTNNQT